MHLLRLFRTATYGRRASRTSIILTYVGRHDARSRPAVRFLLAGQPHPAIAKHLHSPDPPDPADSQRSIHERNFHGTHQVPHASRRPAHLIRDHDDGGHHVHRPGIGPARHGGGYLTDFAVRPAGGQREKSAWRESRSHHRQRLSCRPVVVAEIHPAAAGHHADHQRDHQGTDTAARCHHADRGAAQQPGRGHVLRRRERQHEYRRQHQPARLRHLRQHLCRRRA